MRKKLLMVALAAGAVLGFGSGFARLHSGAGPFGNGRRAAFERRVAETCTQSALRVYEEKSAREKP